MGVYLYAIRKTPVVKVAISYGEIGEVVTAYPLKFLYRCSFIEPPIYDKLERSIYNFETKKREGVERSWGGVDLLPLYVYLGDKPSKGAPVIRWTGGIFWYDTDKFAGEVVGHLYPATDGSKIWDLVDELCSFCHTETSAYKTGKIGDRYNNASGIGFDGNYRMGISITPGTKLHCCKQCSENIAFDVWKSDTSHIMRNLSFPEFVEKIGEYNDYGT